MRFCLESFWICATLFGVLCSISSGSRFNAILSYVDHLASSAFCLIADRLRLRRVYDAYCTSIRGHTDFLQHVSFHACWIKYTHKPIQSISTNKRRPTWNMDSLGMNFVRLTRKLCWTNICLKCVGTTQSPEIGMRNLVLQAPVVRSASLRGNYAAASRNLNLTG